MIKIGICGFGKAVEEFHIPGIKNSGKFKIVSVFDITPARLDKAKKQLGAQVYTDYKEFLASSPDLVIIATPSNSHTEYALKTIDAGIGVVIEKPMALTQADCGKIIKLAKKKNVLLTVHHNRRWDGDFLSVKKIVTSGVLGEIKSIASRVMNYGSVSGYSVPEFDTDWRYKKGFGGGQLSDFGAHLIDQVLDLIGQVPSKIKCELKKEVWSKETDTYFKLVLKFKNKITAEIMASQISKTPLPRWEITGEKGSLLCESGGGPIKLSSEGKEKTITIEENQYHKFYSNLDSAFTGKKELAIKPEEACNGVTIIENAYNMALSSSPA